MFKVADILMRDNFFTFRRTGGLEKGKLEKWKTGKMKKREMK